MLADSRILLSLSLLAMLLASYALTQARAFPARSLPSRPAIGVGEETLFQAERVGFNYEVVLEQATRGDPSAVHRILAFSKHTDAAGSLDHGSNLMLLLHRVGDNTFADAARACSSDERRCIRIVLEYGALEYRGEAFIKEIYTLHPQTSDVLTGSTDE